MGFILYVLQENLYLVKLTIKYKQILNNQSNNQ